MSITHPWATRRLNKQLTQDEVAEWLNVNRQTVIRLEQGMFHTPSEYILKELGDIYNAPIGDLIEEYSGFVKTTREEFAASHPNFSEFFKYALATLLAKKTHPLVYYRESFELSRLGFCRAMCLDYGPVADYEKNAQRGLPATIKAACSDMKWDYAPLESAVTEWRLRCR